MHAHALVYRLRVHAIDCLLGVPRNTSVQCSGQWVGTHERTAACKRPMLSTSKHTHTSGPSCSHGCAVRTVHCIKVEHGRETLYYLPGSIPATVNRHDHDHRPCTGQSVSATTNRPCLRRSQSHAGVSGLASASYYSYTSSSSCVCC